MSNNNGKDLFEWDVYEEYIEEPHEANNGLGHFYPELFIKGQGEYRKYSPADYPTLYAEFQRINDKQSALKFIREFGLPGGKIESLKQIFIDARNVHECLRLYNALKNNLPLQGIDLEELRMKDRAVSYKNLSKYSKEKIDAMGILKWGQIVQEEFMKADKYRTPEQGREALMEHINKHIEGVRPTLACYKGEFTFNRTCSNLLQYIYLQIFDHVTSRKGFVQCLGCGSWFTPTKQGMKFCPPLPGKRKSSCANLYYTRKHREGN